MTEDLNRRPLSSRDTGWARAIARRLLRSGQPDKAAASRFDRDYRIFLEMHRQRQALDDIQ